jgi:hypothetical protein
MKKKKQIKRLKEQIKKLEEKLMNTNKEIGYIRTQIPLDMNQYKPFGHDSPPTYGG